MKKPRWKNNCPHCTFITTTSSGTEAYLCTSTRERVLIFVDRDYNHSGDMRPGDCVCRMCCETIAVASGMGLVDKRLADRLNYPRTK